MFLQCDDAGNQYRLMSGIVDHKSNEKAVSKSDQYVVIRGRKFPRKTTVGWKLCVEWRESSTSWERLSDMKKAYPVMVSEYATTQEIIEEPAFALWFPYLLRKRDRIIAGVKARFLKKRFKYGFEVPETVARAIEIDDINGNTLWQDGIEKEITAVRVAFKTLNEGDEPPPGYQYMKCHMIFEIKLDGFRREARLVGAGCMVKDTPAVVTYASVMLRETVRIALTIAALNDLEVKASNVMNAFITAPCAEKIRTTLGPEFGDDVGKKAIIVRALYGLKLAGSSFGNHIEECMRLVFHRTLVPSLH